jgi:hypothetical protein
VGKAARSELAVRSIHPTLNERRDRSKQDDGDRHQSETLSLMKLRRKRENGQPSAAQTYLLAHRSSGGRRPFPVHTPTRVPRAALRTRGTPQSERSCYELRNRGNRRP